MQSERRGASLSEVVRVEILWRSQSAKLKKIHLGNRKEKGGHQWSHPRGDTEGVMETERAPEKSRKENGSGDDPARLGFGLCRPYEYI